MADTKDVTVEAQELNDAEAFLQALKTRRDEDAQRYVLFLREIDEALKTHKAQYNLAIALGKDKDKDIILESTRGLLKRREALEKMLKSEGP